MRRVTKGFTLVELLVVIAIIALLVSILLPALNRAREHAKLVVCKANLHNYGLAGRMYLLDNDEAFMPSGSYIYDPTFDDGSEPWCRWHNPNYDLRKFPEKAGRMWTYMASKDIHMCPTFFDLAEQFGASHPRHDPTIPIVPQYSYGMNAFLGSPVVWGDVKYESEVPRPSGVFWFSEENMWTIPGLSDFVLNGTAMLVLGAPIGDGFEPGPVGGAPAISDAFATYHFPPGGDLNAGSANAVFLDGHVELVRVGVDNAIDGARMAWPYSFARYPPWVYPRK